MAALPRLTILVVDDEASVRNIIIRILERADYRMLEADSATEALTLSNCFEGVIDLLIADHLLKTLTGRQVAEQMRQARPRLKVLNISGHSLEQIEREGGLIQGSDFLAKPFTAKTLTEKVKQITGADLNITSFML